MNEVVTRFTKRQATKVARSDLDKVMRRDVSRIMIDGNNVDALLRQPQRDCPGTRSEVQGNHPVPHTDSPKNTRRVLVEYRAKQC
ncbi:hypothetical protein GCM10009827_101520 [Dactylosporangium maewongense]|uniref:Uncharacterized protein n=1 Tax=Dactylosporangium maewongense TaxID=634393 RepID=A0ABP4NRI7_9ACTN